MHGPFTSFQPVPDGLLRRTSQYVDDELLNEIAAADYGREVNEHLIRLRQIRDGGPTLLQMRWYPREVLELIRWSEPELPDWTPGLSGTRGHWLRAFSCSALLRAAGESENADLRVGWNQTLIQLIDSLRAIGPELYRPAAAFLAWLIPKAQSEGDTEELGFFMIGLLWLALHMRAADEVVIGLSESAIAAAERQIQINSGRWSDRWLLGTTTYDLRHASWEKLGLSLTEMNLDSHSPLARDWIKLIGHELGGK